MFRNRRRIGLCKSLKWRTIARADLQFRKLEFPEQPPVFSGRREFTMSDTIIARLVRTPDRPERLALIKPDGRVSNWFAYDDTREDIAAVLAKAGLTLRDDDTVVRRSR
jgi:hypothetical protein